MYRAGAGGGDPARYAGGCSLAGSAQGHAEASQILVFAEAEKNRGTDLAARLAMPQDYCGRHQILLKGLSEAQTAARPCKLLRWC